MAAVLDALVRPPKQSDDPIIGELARLEARRVEIEAATNRLLVALADVPKRERAAYAEFAAACKSGDQHRIDNALRDWLEWEPKAAAARREFNANQAVQRFGGDWTRFSGEFPHARNTLLARVAGSGLRKRRNGFLVRALRQRSGYKGRGSPLIRSTTIRRLPAVRARLGTYKRLKNGSRSNQLTSYGNLSGN